MLAKARTEAGLSQEYIANIIHVSRHTYRQWELGKDLPNIYQMLQVFSICGKNPLRSSLNAYHPEVYEKLEGRSTDMEVLGALTRYLQDFASPHEIRAIAYFIFGDHGSSWYGLCDMFLAHAQSSLRSRLSNCNGIVANHEADASTGDLVGCDHVQPDMELVKRCYESAKQSIKNREKAYIPDKMA